AGWGSSDPAARQSGQACLGRTICSWTGYRGWPAWLPPQVVSPQHSSLLSLGMHGTGYKMTLVLMEGCNHWEGAGQPRGLIPFGGMAALNDHPSPRDCAAK